MFMVLSSWHSHSKSSPGSSDEYSLAQAPGRRRPLTKANQLEPQIRLSWQLSYCIHNRHL